MNHFNSDPPLPIHHKVSDEFLDNFISNFASIYHLLDATNKMYYHMAVELKASRNIARDEELVLYLTNKISA